MSNIGDILKSRRVEKGLSLADVHEATKISMQSIAALEENRFDAFPNKVYSRAFLRDYANFLELDSEQLLNMQEGAVSVAQPASAPEKKGKSKVGAIAAAVVVLAAVGGGAYYVSQHPGMLKFKKPNKPAVTKPAEPTQPAATRPTTPAEPNRPGPTSTVVVPDKVAVSLTADNEDVWVMVKVDNKNEFMNTLPAGGTKTFSGKEIFVQSGKAHKLKVKIDGKDQGYLGPAREIVKKTFVPNVQVR